MNNEQEQPIAAKEIFTAACRLSSRVERAEFLDAVCKSNADLRQHIEHLLAAEDDSQSSPLDRVTAMVIPTELMNDSSPFPPPLADIENHPLIGPYKVLEKIGEGGMGVVYMAEQSEPVQRRVALKIIKPGMDTRQVIARFEAERQALTLMEHPNIARVLDAGATDSGRPYFAMELVKGIPITNHFDQQHLTPRERLELFIPVCQAVQHAHQKGIIHRDLKPSNVLIALFDGQPLPKVIDFGVAKATGQRLTERTMFTQYGQLVGTIEYMSPEQANLNQLDIDTRSDIYSLGVLLYELLTGSTPFDRDTLKQAGFDGMRRIIREVKPPRPSARISTLGAAPLSTICEQRHIDPRKLSFMLRGELDWIVMKALEKDRNRRYETANDMAADIRRYLDGDAVRACPPTAWYRCRKFARRNKFRLVVAACALALIVASGANLGWSLRAKWRQQSQVDAEVKSSFREVDLFRARRSGARRGRL